MNLQFVRAVPSPEPIVPSPRITVVFLLYPAAHVAPALVEGLTRQARAGHPDQSDWLEALLMDDASTDGTSRAVEASLLALGSPPNYRLLVNPGTLKVQPALDLSYTVGLAQGLWYLVRGDARGPIT
jgi:hypothetical protein